MTASDGIWPWVWRTAPVLLVLLAGWLGVRYATHMPGRSYSGPFAPLTEEETNLREELRGHVQALAGTIGERNMIRYRELQAAADYIAGAFREMGYAVREQEFSVDGITVKNLEAELPGLSLPGEIVVIGAHYDSVIGSPGANDNATGAAALLALARRARAGHLARTVRFVAFVNEEPPFFQGDSQGSKRYAREAARQHERIVAMLSLETLGCYSDRKASQSYPLPFSFFYPDTGNFVAFVGNPASRELVHRVIRAFREHTRFPSEGVAAPAIIPGIAWSDHSPFWNEGYQALMVTDTALFRYPQYHTQRDTPEIVQYDRLARVLAGLGHVLRELAGSGGR